MSVAGAVLLAFIVGRLSRVLDVREWRSRHDAVFTDWAKEREKLLNRLQSQGGGLRDFVEAEEVQKDAQAQRDVVVEQVLKTTGGPPKGKAYQQDPLVKGKETEEIVTPNGARLLRVYQGDFDSVDYTLGGDGQIVGEAPPPPES